MLDDIRDIVEFYNSNPNGEHDRLTATDIRFMHHQAFTRGLKINPRLY